MIIFMFHPQTFAGNRLERSVKGTWQMRILLIDNLLIRRYGKLRMGPGRALACGAVRGNHRLCEFSDRDMARFFCMGIQPFGKNKTNKMLFKTAMNFRPDAILMGHCDFIENDTLDAIRRALPRVRIAHFNVDPLCDAHPQEQMRARMYSCDALFATTASAQYLRPFVTGKNVVAYIPNPADSALETLDNSLFPADSFASDLFYAGNPRVGDPRLDFLTRLRATLSHTPLRFNLVGMFGTPSVVGGAAYDTLLAQSKMGLNVNRYFDMKWYSSDRIAHLMGSGILSALYDGDDLQHFFSADEALWFHDVPDLVEKLLWFNTHDDERATVAAAGRQRYHAMFSGERILRFMLEILFQTSPSESYEWAEEIYR